MMAYEYPLLLTSPRALTQAELVAIVEYGAVHIQRKLMEVLGYPLLHQVDFDNPVTISPDCLACVYGDVHENAYTYLTCNNPKAKAVLHEGSDGDDWPVDFNCTNVATCTGFTERTKE